MNKGNLRTRLHCWILIVAVLLSTLSYPVDLYAGIKAPAKLGGHHAFAVIDARSGELIVGDKYNNKVYPASTTKLMTASVLVEKGKLDQVVTVRTKDLKKVEPDLSKYGLKPGEKYKLGTLLNMILISSDGDATVCAAIAVFGSITKCVKAMNKKVSELGLKGTSFDNPAGLDIGNNYYNNYTTAYDMAMITRYAMAKPDIQKIVAKSSYLVKQASGKKGKVIQSTNAFYNGVSYSKKLYNIIGSKTGTTRAAGSVFSATAIDSQGREVICTYMGRDSKNSTFSDIRKILDKVYNSAKKKKLKLSVGSQKIKTSKAKYEVDLAGKTKLDLKAYVVDAKTGIKLDYFGGKLKYVSSDNDIATVDSNGIVTLKGEGDATINIIASQTPYYGKNTVKIVIKVIKSKEDTNSEKSESGEMEDTENSSESDSVANGEGTDSLEISEAE